MWLCSSVANLGQPGFLSGSLSLGSLSLQSHLHPTHTSPSSPHRDLEEFLKGCLEGM